MSSSIEKNQSVTWPALEIGRLLLKKEKILYKNSKTNLFFSIAIFIVLMIVYFGVFIINKIEFF